MGWKANFHHLRKKFFFLSVWQPLSQIPIHFSRIQVKKRERERNFFFFSSIRSDQNSQLNADIEKFLLLLLLSILPSSFKEHGRWVSCFATATTSFSSFPLPPPPPPPQLPQFFLLLLSFKFPYFKTEGGNRSRLKKKMGFLKTKKIPRRISICTWRQEKKSIFLLPVISNLFFFFV